MAFNKRDYKEFDHLVNQAEVDELTTGTIETTPVEGATSIPDKAPRFWVADLLYRLRNVTQAAGLELLDTCDSHALAVFLSNYEPNVWW